MRTTTEPERGGRPRRGRLPLRGWGGVAAMACACALALTAVVTPLRGDGPAGPDAAPAGGSVQHTAAFAADETCDPRKSLRPDPSGGDGPAVQRIRAHKRLVVGVDQNSYLWGYRDPATAKIVGFDIALVRKIAESVLDDPDAEVVLKAVPTDQRVRQILDHKVDMVVRTMTITCDPRLAFSTAYFEAGQQLLAPKTSGVRNLDDLAGRRVCTARGSTGADLLRREPHGTEVVLVDNQLDCLVRLQLGEVAAVVTDNALAAGQAAQDPNVHLVGDRLTTEYYGVAMHPDDTDLVRRVNAVLEEYRAGGDDSQWMRSFDEWLDAWMERPAAPPEADYRD